jgi:glycosyltransferase involved in cell wall biosynthesis
VCASERQRDYWLGWLEALGRINPRTHGADPALRGLIDVVPFGVPAEPPLARRAGPRRELRLAEGDVLLLWGGGVYDWFDPVTVVRAVERVPHAHLVFMSAAHPSPWLPPSRALAEARDAAGDRVRFHESWVEYEDRAAWLLDADVGVSAHLEHVEARFAFRTRVLDYLWAGLPVLCTEGDSLAEEISAEGIGTALAPGDVDGWAAAIERMADPATRAACGGRAMELAERLSWGRAAEPLLRWCADPRPAADRDGGPLREPMEPVLSRRRLGSLVRRARRS